MVEDITDAIKWTRENINLFGGDPDRINLIGHSAGAHLCTLAVLNLAGYYGEWEDDITSILTDQRQADRKVLSCVSNVICLSGVYDISFHYQHESQRTVSK